MLVQFSQRLDTQVIKVVKLVGKVVANNLVAARLLAPAPALNLAQLACPIAVQAVTGPLHLLGLDLYNRAGAVSVASRLRASVKNYGPVVAARMMRSFAPPSDAASSAEWACAATAAIGARRRRAASGRRAAA